MTNPPTPLTDAESTCLWCKRLIRNHMYGYYISFDPTGVEEIDHILCSIASAGKAYHHTESWGEGGCCDLIQKAAREAASMVEALQRHIRTLECPACKGTGKVFDCEDEEYMTCRCVGEKT